MLMRTRGPLSEAIRLMAEIDAAIPKWPIE
jgi:hypothetical protein